MPLPLLLAPAALQTLGGLGQTLFSGAGKAQRELENLQTPTRSASRPINEYYNKAMERYNVNPLNSVAYKNNVQQIGTNLSAGINALQGRRSALDGISALVGGTNDASLNAGAQAEAEQNQKFNQLGGATEMKNQDDLDLFNTNQMLPFQKQLQLLTMKAQAANSVKAAGMQNLFQGASNGATVLSKYLDK